MTDKELVDLFFFNSAKNCIVKNRDGSVNENQTILRIKDLLYEISVENDENDENDENEGDWEAEAFEAQGE